MCVIVLVVKNETEGQMKREEELKGEIEWGEDRKEEFVEGDGEEVVAGVKNING